MIANFLEWLRFACSYLQLTRRGRLEHRKDRSGLSTKDPGIERTVEEAIGWLCRAQDNTASHDNGVARHYSLISGWGASYPETTGYIVPTLIAYAKSHGNTSLLRRAKRMLDWLASIQFPNGSFQGGTVGNDSVATPVTFNTGQILLGLCCGVREFGEEYIKPVRRAADWLVATQDPDGCWLKYPTSFAIAGEKAYETHVAWGLLEAARVAIDKPYAEAALANVKWALHLQNDNGWFRKCCLTDPSKPLTHTIGYALRGILEAYRFTNDIDLLHACVRTADGLLKAIRLQDGFLPGRLDQNWHGTVSWACLTGTVQISQCWLMLYQYTGDTRYRDAAYAANRHVRRTVKVNGPYETRGAIKGSFPVYGGYANYQYVNWACKFFVDSNILEQSVRGH